jgi:hypothetical protein
VSLHSNVKTPKGSPRKGDARLTSVVCAKRGCKERLTVAAVHGGSKHCSREHAGLGVRAAVEA